MPTSFGIPKNASRWGFLAIGETTYGTAPTLDPEVDAYRLIKPAGVKVAYSYDGQREGKSPSTYARVQRVGAEGRHGEFEWHSEAAGAGVSYVDGDPATLPIPHLCFLANGFTYEVSGGAVIYTPGEDADFTSLAVESYEDGQKFALQGCMGEGLEIGVKELGHIATITSKMKGIMAATPTDAAIPSTIDYNGTIGPKATVMSIALGTGTPFAPQRVHRFSLKQKTGLTDRYFDEVNGRHGGFYFGEQREFHLELDIEAPGLKTGSPYYDADEFNSWLLTENGNTLPFTLTVGTVATKRFTISGSNAQVATPAREKKGAVACIKLMLDLMPSSETTNDEVTITYN